MSRSHYLDSHLDALQPCVPRDLRVCELLDRGFESPTNDYNTHEIGLTNGFGCSNMHAYPSGILNGYGNGNKNGYANSNMNGYGNGNINGYANGNKNGYANGNINGFGNGNINGFGNGNLNGYGNGNINGYGNGNSNYNGFGIPNGVTQETGCNEGCGVCTVCLQEHYADHTRTIHPLTARLLLHACRVFSLPSHAHLFHSIRK